MKPRPLFAVLAATMLVTMLPTTAGTGEEPVLEPLEPPELPPIPRNPDEARFFLAQLVIYGGGISCCSVSCLLGPCTTCCKKPMQPTCTCSLAVVPTCGCGGTELIDT